MSGFAGLVTFAKARGLADHYTLIDTDPANQAPDRSAGVNGATALSALLQNL